jgi:hypothetical protein
MAGAVDDWTLLRWTNGEGDALSLAPPRAEETATMPPAPFGIAYPAPLKSVGRVYLWGRQFPLHAHSRLCWNGT